MHGLVVLRRRIRGVGQKRPEHRRQLRQRDPRKIGSHGQRDVQPAADGLAVALGAGKLTRHVGRGRRGRPLAA